MISVKGMLSASIFLAIGFLATASAQAQSDGTECLQVGSADDVLNAIQESAGVLNVCLPPDPAECASTLSAGTYENGLIQRRMPSPSGIFLFLMSALEAC